MITLVKLKSAVAAVTLLLFVLTSCSKKEETVSPNAAPVANKVSDEARAQFKKLGFDVSDIKFVTQNNPLTGEKMQGYLLEGDVFITPENLKGMLASDIKSSDAVKEQYRTYNLVWGNPRTIRVLGWTGSGYNLDSKMQTALQWAVANYNALYGSGFGFNFTLSWGSNSTGYDIVVYRVDGSGGGQAGFPAGGNPYKWVQIQSGTSSYTTDVVEHVITHEIGHCLGLRHTDWYNRALSCGSGGSEGSEPDGAVHIPYTPTGYDGGSIMKACFGPYDSGEFSYYDTAALKYLY